MDILNNTSQSNSSLDTIVSQSDSKKRGKLPLETFPSAIHPAQHPQKQENKNSENNGDGYEKYANELKQCRENVEEQRGFISDKIQYLRKWICDTFGVSGEGDVEGWCEDQLKERTEQESQEKLLPLRIKLVDDSSRKASPTTNTGNTINTSSPAGEGTGSKNLSRMNNKPPPEKLPTKPANQIPSNVFWAYVEQYFKNIDECDLAFLSDTRIQDSAPFVIPPLGKRYEMQWKEQFGYICGITSAHRRDRKRFRDDAPAAVDLDSQRIKIRRISLLKDKLDLLLKGYADVWGSSAAASAPLDDDGIEDNLRVGGEANDDDDNSMNSTPPLTLEEDDLVASPSRASAYLQLDERIKRQLSSQGLALNLSLTNLEEDDEICAELRALQTRLREQTCLNHYRKQRVLQVVKSRLAPQEFYSLVSEIDHQLEATFVRKYKSVGGGGSKKRKKSSSSSKTTQTMPTSSASLPLEKSEIPLIGSRKRLLESFSDLIPSLQDTLAIAVDEDEAQKRSKDVEEGTLFPARIEEQILAHANATGNWLGIPKIPLKHTKMPSKCTNDAFPSKAQP